MKQNAVLRLESHVTKFVESHVTKFVESHVTKFVDFQTYVKICKEVRNMYSKGM